MAKSKTIKMRVKAKKGVATVKALMTHPMETGFRKKKGSDEKYPAHFIQEVLVSHNGNNVMTALWGGAVSKNPYLSFKFNGAEKGDELTVSWTDNQGNKDTQTGKIK